MATKQKEGIYVIGDTHFEVKAFEQGEALIQRCLEICTLLNPVGVVLLGDILHTHETAKQSSFDQACRFIEELSKLSHVYVQIGNHDLINQNQFLSDKHFFKPLKKWKDVTIVDSPTVIDIIEGHQIVSCPYTPSGRLVEALDTLEDQNINWTESSCIFAHQEIRGVLYNNKPSTTGDPWPEDFPLLISGHIHDSCDIGENVMYVGSSRQINYTESSDKKVWHILFDKPKSKDYEYKGGVWIRKIALGLKSIKEIEIKYEDIKTFDCKSTEDNYIVLFIDATNEQIKVFRKSQTFLKLQTLGVKIKYRPRLNEESISSLGDLELPKGDGTRASHSFEDIFQAVLDTKSEPTKMAYKTLNGDKLYYNGDSLVVIKTVK